jgi:hypothetical protein
MERLSSSRPIFHSEADFQHAFAWECQRLHPEARVRLECRPFGELNERLDLFLTLDGVRIAVELKYPLAALSATVDGEVCLLREQAAIDRMRFSYVWDIVRLERIVAENAADVGVAVLLTNVVALWRQPRPSRRLAADTQFRVHEGRELARRLAWSGDAVWWRKERLPEAVELVGRYPVSWAPYSTVSGVGCREFRWTTAVISERPMASFVASI